MVQGPAVRAIGNVSSRGGFWAGAQRWGGRALRFGGRALGVFGLFTLAADAMEWSRPYVWSALGIKDPNAVEAPAPTSPANALQLPYGGRVYYAAPNSDTPVAGIYGPTDKPFAIWLENPFIHDVPGLPWHNQPSPGNIRVNVRADTGEIIKGGMYDSSYVSRIRIIAYGPPGSPTAAPTNPMTKPAAKNPPVVTSNPDAPPNGKKNLPVGTPVTTATPGNAADGRDGKGGPLSVPQNPASRNGGTNDPGTNPASPQNPTKTQPDPLPTPTSEPPPPKAPPEVDTEDCNPCEALAWIVDELKRKRDEKPTSTPPQYESIGFQFVVCEEGQDGHIPKIERFYLELKPGQFNDVIKARFDRNIALAVRGCESGDAIAAIPDWWQVRLGADRPQICVIYRVAGKRNYHTLAIPHPRSLEAPKSPPLPPYRNGPWQGQVILLDNSKFTVNAASQGEAQRVIDAAMGQISPSMLGGNPRVYIAQRKGIGVIEADMTLVRAEAYPNGQKGTLPSWRVPFDRRP
jgi:hypothetical protein